MHAAKKYPGNPILLPVMPWEGQYTHLYGTVIRDDPELTVRHVPCSRQPRRVVIDSRLDLPPTAKILAGEPPIVLTISEDAGRRRALEARGAEVVVVPREGEKTGKNANDKDRRAEHSEKEERLLPESELEPH